MKLNKKFKKTGLVLVTILTGLGLISCGAHRDRHHDRNTDNIMKHAVKKLDLTADQQGKLSIVLEDMESFKSKMKTQHSDFSAPFKENLAKADINLVELNEHFDTFELELRQFRQNVLVNYADFHSSLNDEQREKLVGYLEKMEKRHRD